MKLHFYGAAKEVTGSRHIVEVAGKKILMDCGLYQGRRKDEVDRNKNFGFDPKEIDIVIISHAHIDHSGNLPNLVKQGFNGPIYCTKPTAELLAYMLLDSAHIQEVEVEYLNEKKMAAGEELVEPLYVTEDVHATLPLIRPVSYEECLMITPEVSACFHEAGHIIGSAITVLTMKENGVEKTLAYTGDLGRVNMPLIQNPYQVEKVDYLMIESTYGNRLHDSLNDAEKDLEDTVKKTVARGGKILIPAFSLGRTQEIIYALHKLSDEGRIPENLPIFVDSPLSVNLTQVFRANPQVLDQETHTDFLDKNEDPFKFNLLKYVTSVEESKALNNLNGPAIIISASGMMEHGRILHHLKNNISDHKNTLIVVGYQAANTLGRKIVDKQKEVKIFGKPVHVGMQIKIMNAYSAHADKNDLLDYISKVDGLKKIILVHGEEDSQGALKQSLLEAGRKDDEVFIPNFGDTLDL